MMTNAAPILILLLLAITFLYSSFEKLTDWNGTMTWLQSHFANTFVVKYLKICLILVLVMEIITGVFCVSGVIELVLKPTSKIPWYAAVFSCLTLLALLFGQRIAKDYDGARKIVIYFIPGVVLVFWL
jgi:uncharacterized membrane protein YphA (DoxX/SURF4 family)